jgi:phage minor structural protein
MGAVDNTIRVYDGNMRKLAYLENAYNIGYSLKLNELWTAQFTLPATDKKNIYCQPFNYVEIFDGGERIELFRIMPSTLTRNSEGNIVYQCEHVLATLMDDVLFQYHQIGNIGVGTVSVLRYILDHQLTKRWQLRNCDFDRRFEYKWENENLLSALFSVPRPFNEGYRWEFDTTRTPWQLDLKRLPTQFVADIIYKKNMVEIKKEVDPSTIVTRLYCLGYGEGDNQLNICSVNGGIPYLEANTATYGIKSSILVDRRFENAETLKAYGQSILDELKNPFKSYSVRAIDLHRKSPSKYERYFPGDIVRVIDKEDDIIENLPIVSVSKSDITGAPGDIEVEIAKRTRDIASSISSLQDRTRINEVYAQGATNQMIVPFADNADENNPARMKIYIPDTMVRINKCILNYQLDNFRAYSKAIEGGGATTQSTNDGGASTQTSSSGGEGIQTSSSGGGGTQTSSSGGGTQTTSDVQVLKPGISQDYTRSSGKHLHTIPNGTVLMVEGGGTVTWGYGGEHYHDLYNHGHQINIPDHHHTVPIPSHTHIVNIPSHTHSINIPNHRHSINLPNHTHDIEFGIYEGTRANSVSIKVDGNILPTTQPGQDINIIPYLSVDSEGKIQRNTWHEVEIIPDQMTRVLANIFMQIFTNSRGGGDY